jgi:hypothetical protein
MNKRDLKFGYSPGKLIDNAQRNFNELYNETERLKNRIESVDSSNEVPVVINLDDWSVAKDRYKYKIEETVHKLSNVYIEDAFVYLDNGTVDKTILQSERLINDDLLVYSDIKIKTKVILKGER